MMRHRLSILSRLIAAFGGGYALISLGVALVSLRPVPDKGPLVLSATMAGLLAYPAIVLAALHARSAGRAWLWIGGACMVLALLLARAVR